MSTANPPTPDSGLDYSPLDDPTFPWPNVELIDTDGEPLESDWHRYAITALTDSIRSYYADRTDFYVGGNMFVYYSTDQARKREFKGPDFYFVRNVPLEPIRRYWVVWDEGGRYPDVIIELLSETTAKNDRTAKKDVYQNTFRTTDYFCYDHDTNQLEGWTLESGVYQPLVPDDRGRLWSKELGLWVGSWNGKYQGIPDIWLRFYTSEGELVLLSAEVERQRAEVERQRADVERQRADGEHQRAEAERQRADALAAELARLQARMQQP